MMSAMKTPVMSFRTPLSRHAAAGLLVALIGGPLCFTTGCQNDKIDPDVLLAGRPKSYECVRTNLPIEIDGMLDDAAWADAPWTEYFVDIEGDRKPTPRYRTRAKMLWDDENLYVAAWMMEPHVWATYELRDMIVFEENDFEIFIDPDGDTRDYFEIEVNALGTIFDLFLVKRYLDGGPALHDWDFKGMRYGVHIDGTLNDSSDRDNGWSVEFALPWKGMAPGNREPKPPSIGDTWRVNFSRVQWRYELDDTGMYRIMEGIPEDNWVWSPQGAVNMHLPSRWGFVRFGAEARPAPTDPDEIERRLEAIRLERERAAAAGTLDADGNLIDPLPTDEREIPKNLDEVLGVGTEDDDPPATDSPDDSGEG